MPRIARTRFPIQYANEYFRQVHRLLKNNRRKVWQAFQEEIRPRVHRYRQRLNNQLAANSFAVNDELEEIRKILQRLREEAENQIFATPIIERIVTEFVENINRYARANFRQQVNRVLGFDPTINEPWLSSFMDTAIKENVSWIKSIPVDHHNKIETIITQGVRRGKSITEMANEITQASDVSIRRARFIARDQIGSIHGDLVKFRQKSVGLTRFRWRTSSDERVRGNPAGIYPRAKPSHYDLNGKIFTWDKGAVGAGGIIPGEDYNCRCTADIVEEDILEVANNG